MPLFNLKFFVEIAYKYDILKTIKDINMKLWILACHDMGQLLDKMHYFKSTL